MGFAARVLASAVQAGLRRRGPVGQGAGADTGDAEDTEDTGDTGDTGDTEDTEAEPGTET